MEKIFCEGSTVCACKATLQNFAWKFLFYFNGKQIKLLGINTTFCSNFL
jgi:hypothetical protein